MIGGQIPQLPACHRLTNTGDSLHNTSPLFLLLLFRSEAHHLAVVAHGGSRLVHVTLECSVEPAADEARRVTCHFGVAGAALAVVLTAALVIGQVVEEALGGGGRLYSMLDNGAWDCMNGEHWKLKTFEVLQGSLASCNSLADRVQLLHGPEQTDHSVAP